MDTLTHLTHNSFLTSDKHSKSSQSWHMTKLCKSNPLEHFSIISKQEAHVISPMIVIKISSLQDSHYFSGDAKHLNPSLSSESSSTNPTVAQWPKYLQQTGRITGEGGQKSHMNEIKASWRGLRPYGHLGPFSWHVDPARWNWDILRTQVSVH